MNLRQISDRIYYLPSSQETDRPVLGYVRGDKYSLMVDAGNSEQHVEIFHDELKKRGLPLPDYVVITHWHWDHTFGMCAVKGKVIANVLTNSKLKLVKTWEWSDEAMKKRIQTGEDIIFCDRCIRLEYPDLSKIKVRTADVEFDKSLILDLGGITCRLSRIKAPHSNDSTIIYIPEEKVVFFGDDECEDFYNNDGKYDLEKLEKFIIYLEELDFVTYIMGHDEPQRKEDVLDYLKGEVNKLQYNTYILGAY